MLNRVGILCALLIACSVAAVADARKPMPLDTPLLDTAAQSRSIAQTVGGKVAVIVFTGRVCPVANRYAPTLGQLESQYRARGVRFVLIYANPGETSANVAAHQKEFGLSHFAALVDTKQRAAQTLGATHTPEAFVLAPAKGGYVVRYKGRIDDGFVSRGVAKTVKTKNDLRDALDAVLSGKSVKTPKTDVIGCLIEPVTAITPPQVPTYSRQVAAIINANCIKCHRDGEVAPMSLQTYEQTKRWAKNIAQVTQTKFMPPWKPVAGHGDFAGERRITAEQVQILQDWASAGAPSGDLAKAPAPPAFVKGWSLGTPDLVLTMPTAWTVKPGSPDNYRCFVIPTGLTEDKDVIALEYRAGNRKVVHHIIGYVDVNGEGRQKDEAEEGAGYTSFGGPGFLPFGEMGGWAPGVGAQTLPNGVARKLPAGSDLVLQVHYNAGGKPEEDITSIGLYFSKTPAKKYLRLFPVAASLNIPAGEAKYQTQGGVPVPFDVDAIFIAPHMHLLGKTFQMDVALPNGVTQPLVKIDDWDFNWQDIYNYKTPVKIPKGSRLSLVATYDNSANNPRNPSSPPKPITWGEATTDEMCIGFIGFTVENENDPIIKILDGLKQRRGAKGVSPSEGTARFRKILGVGDGR